MMERLRRGWDELSDAKPGERFTRRYERNQRKSAPLRRWTVLAAGAALMVTGLVLLPAPGPGILVVVIGASLIAEESAWAARTLDAVELWGRNAVSKAAELWRSTPSALKALYLAAASAAVAGAAVAAVLIVRALV